MAQIQQKRLLEIIKQEGVIRPRDIDKYQIPRNYLYRLHRDGVVVRVGRGLYMLPDAEITEHHSLVEASKRVPKGVICLLSALRFHELTTQAPFEVWMAIDPKMWLPQVDNPPLHIVRFSGQALNLGVEEHSIEGVPVKVYEPAKTVVDCFRYRNKIGLDVALEALRDYLATRQESRGKCYTVDKLWEYAKHCRMSRVMMPYMESMV